MRTSGRMQRKTHYELPARQRDPARTCCWQTRQSHCYPCRLTWFICMAVLPSLTAMFDEFVRWTTSKIWPSKILWRSNSKCQPAPTAPGIPRCRPAIPGSERRMADALYRKTRRHTVDRDLLRMVFRPGRVTQNAIPDESAEAPDLEACRSHYQFN